MGNKNALEKVMIVSGDADGKVKIWKPSKSKVKNELSGHTNRVRSLAKIDGKIVASGSYDRSVRIWGTLCLIKKSN